MEKKIKWRRFIRYGDVINVWAVGDISIDNDNLNAPEIPSMIEA